MGFLVDEVGAAGLWLLDTGGWWLLLLITVTVEEDGLCVDVEGLELQCEVLAALLEGELLLCVEVGCDGCFMDAPLRHGGVWSCLDRPILWSCLCLPTR